MIVLSLVLVIVAAVTLIAGFFQDEELTLIYVAIVSCVLAMAALGVGVLQRKRTSTPASDAGYGGGSAPTGSSAPARSSAPATITPVRPKEPVGTAASSGASTAADAESGDGAQVIVRKATAADAARRTAGGKATKKAVVKKAVARRPATDEATASPTAATAKAAPAKSAAEKAAAAKKAPAKASAAAAEATADETSTTETSTTEASATKKSATKKSAAKKSAAKKATAKKATAKKATAKKSAAKKSTAKKSSGATRTTGGGKAEAREVLASVKGLGPAKQDRVLAEFGTVAALRQASVEQLADLKGIGDGLASAIKDAVS